MFHPDYEKIVQFASEGELGEELSRARAEFIERTGDMFESDEAYERRIATFLEWYVLDRPVSFAGHMTPAKMYIDHVTADLTTPELTALRTMTKTVLSLYEFKKAKPDRMRVVDLLTSEKLEIFERRKPAGLENGDILEARLIPKDDILMFSETIGVSPREAKKTIRKAAKKYRKQRSTNGRIDLVHRVAYLANRCERYAHVDPREIFADLLD